MKIVEVHEEAPGLTSMNLSAVAIYKGTIEKGAIKYQECLGSGFLVFGEEFQVMTAKHVVELALNLKEQEGIYFLFDTLQKDSEARGIWKHVPISYFELVDDYDVALGYVEPSIGSELVVPGLKLADEINRNASIVNIEYSAATSTLVYQSIRRGNIVYIHDWFYDDDLKGVNIIETSFACLKGASGSPVVDANNNHFVIGMMIKNVDHQLAPTQVIRAYKDDGSPLEEIHYLAPQGLAISAYGLQDALKSKRKKYAAINIRPD